MADNNVYSPIPARLHSVATEGVVSGSDEIFDDAKGKRQSVINQETDAALDNKYDKDETYSKQELNNLITTPNQDYVTVPTYGSLPATGEADTVYRVSNYDGEQSQIDATKYSEYAWDGTQYVFLCVKTQIGEVFDITAYNSNTKYADLTAALGVDGVNVPVGVRKGGMSVKFVQSSDNKYVQARCMAQNFTTDVTQWQGVDDEPTAESRNLIISNPVYSLQSNFKGTFDKYLKWRTGYRNLTTGEYVDSPTLYRSTQFIYKEMENHITNYSHAGSDTTGVYRSDHVSYWKNGIYVGYKNNGTYKQPDGTVVSSLDDDGFIVNAYIGINTNYNTNYTIDTAYEQIENLRTNIENEIEDIREKEVKNPYIEDCNALKELFINSVGAQLDIANLGIVHGSNGVYDVLFANSDNTTYTAHTEVFSEPKNGILPIYKGASGVGALVGYCIVDWSRFGTYFKPIKELAFNLDCSPSISQHINILKSKCKPFDDKDLFKVFDNNGLTLPFVSTNYIPDTRGKYRIKYSLSATANLKIEFIETNISGKSYGSYFSLDNENLYIHLAENGSTFVETSIKYTFPLGWKISDYPTSWVFLEIERDGEYFQFNIYRDDLSQTFSAKVKAQPMKFIDFTQGLFGVDIGLCHGNINIQGTGIVTELSMYSEVITPRILVLGDSISEGWGCVEKDKRYTELLQKRFGNCINMAVSGANATGYGLYIKDKITMFKPDYFLIYLGTNTDATFRTSYQTLVTFAKANATKGVVLCTIPTNESDSNWIRTTYASEEGVTIADIAQILSPAGIKVAQYYDNIDMEGNAYSDVHPNEKGQVEIYRTIIKASDFK